MTLESYLTFVGASVLLVLAPGPDFAYLLSRSLAQGRKAGLLGALGVNLGAYVHLLASVTGLSAILMTSALAFSVVKWAGAAYLVWLGIGALRSRGGPVLPNTPLRGASAKAIFWQGFLSDALNPKVAMFYLALLPQFVSPHSRNVVGELLVLGLTVNMIGLVGNILFVLASEAIGRRARANAKVSGWLQKAMGATFIGLGARLAMERR